MSDLESGLDRRRRRRMLLEAAEHLSSGFVHYNTSGFSAAAVCEAVKAGDITIEEIVAQFRLGLETCVGEIVLVDGTSDDEWEAFGLDDTPDWNENEDE